MYDWHLCQLSYPLDIKLLLLLLVVVIVVVVVVVVIVVCAGNTLWIDAKSLAWFNLSK